MFDTVTLLAERDLLKEHLIMIKWLLNQKDKTDKEKIFYIKQQINTLILDEKE